MRSCRRRRDAPSAYGRDVMGAPAPVPGLRVTLAAATPRPAGTLAPIITRSATRWLPQRNLATPGAYCFLDNTTVAAPTGGTTTPSTPT
jgi:hypothetical protein